MSDEPLSPRSRTMFGLAGAAVIAVAATMVVLGSTEDHDGSTYYTATFGRAGQGLDPGKSDVKIRGIAVGRVDDVTLDGTGKVAVRFRVDKGVRIPRTTSARIEPVSVFGPKDLTLSLGAGEIGGPYLPDGGTVARTTDPKDLSETAWPAYRLTKAINPDEVETLLRTFSAGLSGQGPALRRTVVNGAKVIDAAHANRKVIESLIKDVQGLSGTFANRGDTINAIVRDANDLAPVIYDKPDKVQQLLDRSGELATRVGTTLNGHGDEIGDIIDGAAPAADVLAKERRNIPVLVDSLNGFFALLSRIIRVPGPENTLLAQVVDTLPLDLCQTFVDACEPSGGGGGSAADQGVRMVIEE